MLNRAAAFALVDRLLEQAQPQRPGAVLVVRVLRMREIELSFGYAVTEALADALERALVAAVRPADQVARIGEADFLVALAGLGDRSHAALAAAKVVRTLQSPVRVDGGEIHPQLAVGIAMCPEDGDTAEQLCRRADRACHQARGTVERTAFWRAPALPRETVQHALRGAIANNELRLFLQPIASLTDGRVVGYEALSRWTHPELGQVPPALFVDVAERSGQIADLTRWSLNVALRQLARLRGIDPRVRVAVNLSVEVLQLPGFVEQVLDLKRLWGVPHNALILEVTESALMRDMAQCERLLAALRDGGVRVSIDDFGTGYSSLAYLHRLPVDTLKIDRSFIHGMADDDRARRLVGTMIELAHDLGLGVVAEGVEQVASRVQLAALGCDFVQGYLIGRPAPADEVVAAARAAAGLAPELPERV